jgi:hypothetical protein
VGGNGPHYADVSVLRRSADVAPEVSIGSRRIRGGRTGTAGNLDPITEVMLDGGPGDDVVTGSGVRKRCGAGTARTR